MPATAGISSISALMAALCAVIGGAVMLSGRRRPSHQTFLYFSTSLFLWHLFSVFRDLRAPLALAALLFVPVTLILFLRTWLRESITSVDLPARGAPRTIWALLLVGELLLFYSYSVSGDPKQAWAARIPPLLKVLVVPSLYLALTPLWQVYRQTVSRVDKRRILYLIGVGLLAITVTVWEHLPTPIGRGGAALGTVLSIVYLYFLHQTLFLERLLDINELLGRVVVLSAFVLLLSAVHMLLTSILHVEPNQVVTVVVFVMLILYEPLRRFLEGQVQRWTTHERIEQMQRMAELKSTLPNVIEPREAVRVALSVLEETRRLTTAAVYLLEADGNGFELVGSFGSRPVERLDAAARRPLLSRLVSKRQPVTLEQLEREHDLYTGRRGSVADLETLDAIARTLVELQAGAVIGIYPTRSSESSRRASTVSGSILQVSEDSSFVPSEQLIGLLCIKDDRSRDAFASAELDLLSAIAAQLGITVQNSQLYERMKERDRLAALGQMAAGLAHEIRNPLGAIKGAAEFIAPGADGRLPEDAGDFVRIVIEETRRLNRVVSQFLDYARPWRGDDVPLDVNSVIEKTVAVLRQIMEEQASTQPGLVVPSLVLELSPDLPQVRGDAEQLRQVFLNLALNAVQAMADKTDGSAQLQIVTGLRPTGRLGSVAHSIEVRFQDKGTGIDPQAMKNLFIPFFTTKERGTGLGLPISQRIIENHGGFIEARNRPGGGATFVVILPCM
ncbi:MAG: ATP-binding protein [Polyangia bacterium]